MIRKETMKGSKKVKVTFVLPRDQPHGTVFLVGDFNGWRPGVDLFARRANRAFSVSVTLEPGGRYAFRYLTGTGEWIDEERPDAREPNGFGGENGVVVT
ncbi:MAG: isoamylase early set domain-containing protein [Candidatus Tectomicrobia bacterium]|nr:isoamylase early set domain-containing protein [Candidatus Tectomicrobia bacterium]MBI3024374.1 isoamylase early set domain-containing protein [Candidatus Tectomicrobia bacterium]